MSSDSGRPNEFLEDAHFWPEDPSHDQLKLWAGPQAKSPRIESPSEVILTQVGLHGKLYQMPVQIRKEED